MAESTWAPTPFAESVAMLQKQIAGYVLMPTDDEVLETALAGIRRAIDRMNTRNWNWTLTYDDIPFSTTATDYPLTSWFKAPRNFEIWNPSNQSVFRLQYKPWQTFMKEHPDITTEGDPCVYSCPNVNALGSVTLNSMPTAGWLAKYPNGRLWYYRRIQYPNDKAEAVDVPSEASLFISEWACGYTADRYAPVKSAPAYARAERQFHELVVDDAHGQQTDWE